MSAGMWRDQALCARTDPHLFHPDRGESVAPAKRICAGCDVRPECLAYALATEQWCGVWGGLSQNQLRALIRQRRELQAA